MQYKPVEFELPEYQPADNFTFLLNEDGKPVLDNVINLPYKPHGKHEDVFYNKARHLIIEGPAGTGKTRTILERIHYICLKYPNTSVAITRAVRVTIPNSVLKTFEDFVLATGDPMKRGATRENRDVYHYANGSEIVIVGFNDPGKLLSTEWNIIYANEADQIPLSSLTLADQRIRRAIGYPHHQLILDINPTYEEHAIYKQGWELVYTYHQDNPLMWQEGIVDGRETIVHPEYKTEGHWTDFGIAYIMGVLAQITDPVQRARFYEGRRILPQGLIYGKVYNPAKNTGHIKSSLLLQMKEMIFNKQANRLDAEMFLEENFHYGASADFNYVLPLSFGFYLIEKKDRVIRQICEFYRTRTTIEDAAKECLAFLGWEYRNGKHIKLLQPELGFSVPLPPYFVCDHDAEDRATLSKYFGKMTRPAMKQIKAGTDGVVQRFQDNRLFIDDIPPIGGIDISLSANYQPTCLKEELLNYKSRVDMRDGMFTETPIKKHDHACDRLRYYVAEEDSIKAVTSGREVARLTEQDLLFSTFGNNPNTMQPERTGGLFVIR